MRWMTRRAIYARPSSWVGLVGREPRVLGLMDVMREFLSFRCESIERRARHGRGVIEDKRSTAVEFPPPPPSPPPSV